MCMSILHSSVYCSTCMTGVLTWLEEGVRFPRTGIADGCTPPCGSCNQTEVLCTVASALHCWAISPVTQYIWIIHLPLLLSNSPYYPLPHIALIFLSSFSPPPLWCIITPNSISSTHRPSMRLSTDYGWPTVSHVSKRVNSPSAANNSSAKVGTLGAPPNTIRNFDWLNLVQNLSQVTTAAVSWCVWKPHYV